MDWEHGKKRVREVLGVGSGSVVFQVVANKWSYQTTRITVSGFRSWFR